MSRSRRKTKIRGMCGSRHHVSEKEDKRKFNRKMRRVNKVLLGVSDDSEKLVLKHKDEIEDVWGFKKDGKRYRKDMPDKEMRK